MAKLILKYNDVVIEEIELKQGDTSIGRRTGNQIVIDNLAVSGSHATIFTVGEDSFIEDLNSTNGTFINNRKITKHHLKHGDTIAVGKHTLTYFNEKAQPVATDFAKTVVLTPGMRPEAGHAEPKSPDAAPRNGGPARQGAIFILTGLNSGKRIDLTKPMTNLGKTGRPAGTIARRGDQYVIAASGDGDAPTVNGKAVTRKGEILRNGDIIEVGDTRLQFHLK